MKINYSTYILIVEVIKIKYVHNLKIVHNLQVYNQFWIIIINTKLLMKTNVILLALKCIILMIMMNISVQIMLNVYTLNKNFKLIETLMIILIIV